MLRTFRVANYRSLRDDHDFSFVATGEDDEAVRMTGGRADGREIGVVPTIGIFGTNASGKSNVVAAIRAMRSVARNSVADWARVKGIPREPFAPDEACQTENTLFEINLLLRRSKVRYTYGFDLSDYRVEAEWLHAYPHGRKQVWFDREADRVDGGEEFRFSGGGLRGSKERLGDITRPNALFLTVGASFNHPQLGAVRQCFIDNFWLVTSDQDVAERSAYTRDLLIDHRRGPWNRKRIESLLRVANLDVVGLIVDESLLAEKQVRLLHRGKAGKSIPFDFATQESLGTHAWFVFLGPVSPSARTGLSASCRRTRLQSASAARRRSRAFVQSGTLTDMRSSPDPRPTKGLPNESVSCHVDSA